MTEIEAVRNAAVLPGHMFGRRVIVLDYDHVDRSNVLEVLGKALAIHGRNAAETQYLWDYYRGKQPILERVKPVRPEINNKVVENRANEIVSFKVGYSVGKPIQYTARKGSEDVSAAIQLLNDYMFAEDKAAQDQAIVEWQMVCGTAYRMVLPDPVDEVDESPFEIYCLDPRETFVVYSADLGNKPIMAVKFKNTLDGPEYSIYTESEFFKVVGDGIIEHSYHALGMIPIFEYPANHARLGAFEIVLPLLDELNNVSSNRMDGLEQQIQAFIKFINCDIDSDGLEALQQYGAIKIKSVQGQVADVDVVKTDVNQDQSQTFKQDIYNSILTICGMPNRNGGSSTSDTGLAVIYRDGWSTAESRALDHENMFKPAEKRMLKLVLKICRDLGRMELKLRDVDIQFTRRNYEAIQSKSQVLCQMLQQAHIHPKLAFEHSGMFSDPEGAYAMSEEYYKQQLAEWDPQEVNENEPGADSANDRRTVQTA